MLVLSQYLEPDYALRLLARGPGAWAISSRTAWRANELVDAALRVAAGGSAIDPAVVDEVVHGRQAKDRLGR